MSSSLILRRGHGFQLDHIGLGVPDTPAGVAALQEQTGAPVHLGDPEPDQFYWSGSLAIAEDSFLEVIGPNPQWTRFHPFGATLKTLPGPQLLFWYVAVRDFAEFQAEAKRHRAALKQVQHINVDGAHAEHAGYSRGYVGPDFLTQRPNVIEWVHRPERLEHDGSCRLTDFRLRHPDAPAINRTFDALGIETRVTDGPSSIGISLGTPKGRLDLDNEGIQFGGISALFKMARAWWVTRRA